MIILFLPFFTLIILGVPIAISMGFSVGLYFFVNNISISLFIQQITSGAGTFSLLALPFFILMGLILGKGGSAKRLIDFANSVVGFQWGGLAQVSILGSMFFAGVSGSSVADAAGIGSILIPEMKRKGYGDVFSVAINAVSSTIGIIIPPSIPMVTYAWVAQESVGKMFLAGIIPGILFGLVQFIIAYIYARKNNYPREPFPKINTLFKNFISAAPSLGIPIIVLGGIIIGVVTPTEAGVLAIAYGLILGIVIYRDIKIFEIFSILTDGIKYTALIMFILATAKSFSWILAYEKVPELIMNLFNNIGAGKNIFLLFVIIFCLFLGTFIGGTSAAIILIAPVFIPVAKQFGIDIIHIGIIIISTLAIGLFTPPVGTTLMISSHIGKITMEQGFKGCIPFLIVMVILILIFAYFPIVVMFLPNYLLR